MGSEGGNLAEISRLNQRGGRSPSIVELLEAATLSVEMAALCWVLVEGGDSFLTGAVPGGAYSIPRPFGRLSCRPTSGGRFASAKWKP